MRILTQELLFYIFIVLRYSFITLDCRVLFKTQRMLAARTIEDPRAYLGLNEPILVVLEYF